jgi:hypothetical protein
MSLRDRLSRAWTYVELGQYFLWLVTRWYGLWIVVALIWEIPEPPLLAEATAYPRATVGLVGAMLFFIAKDAARYQWREHWEDDDDCEDRSVEEIMEAHNAE